MFKRFISFFKLWKLKLLLSLIFQSRYAVVAIDISGSVSISYLRKVNDVLFVAYRFFISNFTVIEFDHEILPYEFTGKLYALEHSKVGTGTDCAQCFNGYVII